MNFYHFFLAIVLIIIGIELMYVHNYWLILYVIPFLGIDMYYRYKKKLEERRDVSRVSR